jgi:RNA-binding protein 39
VIASNTHTLLRLYVGSLHFNLTESDIKQVFEPFGELEFVDLHRDPTTGRSKGYAFVQLVFAPCALYSQLTAMIDRYKRAEDAKMALEQMEGFELAGRQLRVNTVHEKGTVKYTQQESLDDSGGTFLLMPLPKRSHLVDLGGNLNAASRQALMQKLARIEPARSPEPMCGVISLDKGRKLTTDHSSRPNIPQTMSSRSVLLTNLFNPEEYVCHHPSPEYRN